VCHVGNAANSLLILFCNFQVDSCHPLLADSIVIVVTQFPHSQPTARRGTLGRFRPEGEAPVNRTRLTGGATPAAFIPAVAETAAVTATLPTGAIDAETAFVHHDVFCLPAHGTSVAAARNRVAELLRQWGVGEPVYDDATLVISELFTNALVHTDSTEISCQLQTTAQTVYLAITDQGLGPTGPQVREPDAESGRGLLLVSALTELWGVRNEHGRGRTVWAILPWDESDPR
jgi:anti-sigma regulatory factor (Ser/Thr protein kinase)